ncbi:cytochrome P450 2J4-like [Amphiura filiformis]|uniref:cytochrome P450 2J4-like n=1 Tax=Amphiura filiformis TaxID=82378 RepID=UPI003B2273A6
MTFIANINIPAILIFVVAFLVLAWWLRKPQQNLPPGPWGWPLLGYLPNLGISMYRTGLPLPQLFNSLAKDYGSVCSLNIAGTLVIVLNNFRCVKDGLDNPDISDRPKILDGHQTMLDAGQGVGGASGEAWKEQRRFTVTALRGLGWVKEVLRNIVEEAEFLAKEISSLNGKAFNPCDYFSNATSNVICAVVFGKRFEYSDISFKHFMRIINENAQTAGLQHFLPLAKYLRTSGMKTIKKNLESQLEFMKRIINDHKKDHVQNDPRDYIDVYLDEIKQKQMLNSDTHVNYKNLPATTRALFAAGTETTSTTLRWAVLYMMAYPEIQDRVHQELDSVVGRNRLPKLADKADLPFTCATLFEVQRIATIVPLGVPHSCGKDTTLGPYTIPKGSIVVPNIWAVHHDPDSWPNPDEFKPERFLDKDGAFHDSGKVIPFAIGRRVCLGEQLAKMELYIFFTHLLHQFTFKKPDDSPSLSLKGHNGIANPPKPYLVQFIARD